MNAPQRQLVETMPARVPAITLTPMDMLSSAVAQGADLATIKELMALRREFETEEARKEFDVAMSRAQAEMLPVATDSHNSQTRSRYASYAALDRAIRPAYTRHGFSLSFNTAKSDDPNCIKIVCEVAHNGKFTKTYQIDMPADGKGAKGGDVMTKTHATGSATTYGMRYLLKMIFNIAVGDFADDDGQAAARTEPAPELISAEQAQALRTALEFKGRTEADFCDIMKSDQIENLQASRFNGAMAWVKNLKEASNA